MKKIKSNTSNTSGRTVKEDLERLDQAGINLDEQSPEQKKVEHQEGVPDTKKQQETGDTERSDRRL